LIDGRQTHGQLFRAVRDQFRQRGLECAELDARLLVAHGAGVDGGAFALIADNTVDGEIARRVNLYAERRLSGEPVARILGKKEFWSLEFGLNEATFVPRPDTEVLVNAALARMANGHDQEIRILDLGTGSGAILIALLSEFKYARGIGIDIDARAITQARENARRHGLGDRCSWLVGDFSAAIGAAMDLVVSNPPYIASPDIAGLDVEVRCYDPRRALDGGADGIDAYRMICAALPGHMKTGGQVLFEVGAGQAPSVGRLLTETGFEVDSGERDLSGVVRVVAGRWRGVE
jgi:release factor glutamine methyltransferase